MYQINKEKFGAFVAALRKERGLTQKELAQQLYISDKAVSKWETAVSVPDTALLIPLAEALGVTVTELLLCEKQPQVLQAQRAEEAVKAAITYNDGKTPRPYHNKNPWAVIFLISAVGGVLGLWWNLRIRAMAETVLTGTLLPAAFGMYFCLFARMELPTYFDQNRIGYYHDGPVRMNIPGVSLNNRNWPHILKAARIWSCLFTAGYPWLNGLMSLAVPGFWQLGQLYVFLALVLGGLFLPLYIVGRKYQ